jgi:hypothetical protein
VWPHMKSGVWGCSAGHEFVDVAVGAPKVLPSRARLAQKLDAPLTQLLTRRCQVIHGEPGDGAGLEVLSPVARSEHFDQRPVREAVDPATRLAADKRKLEHVPVEGGEFLGPIGHRAQPSEPNHFHKAEVRRRHKILPFGCPQDDGPGRNGRRRGHLPAEGRLVPLDMLPGCSVFQPLSGAWALTFS